MQKYYLAIDIGASSGRHIVGWRKDGEIRTKEVYRFPNGVWEENGSLVWDAEALLRERKTVFRQRKRNTRIFAAFPSTPGAWTMFC